MSKKIVFNNLRELGITNADIIIYYNNHYAKNKLEICDGLDDCISVLVDCKYIDDDEIRDDLIEYYEATFKNNPQLAMHIVSDYLNNKDILNV